ncbi:D-alanyl-D-alanine carboxypeptidase [Brevibacillus parabrevis]|uniref:Uncharacterized protein n=1 Tax=Brevibacillus parabrevis TaxID=54914 RepID=A0A4Y3PLE6_BREPA|nr:D-alanyl-D-alanine carboxypeptidase [Brevibacillus parabrevis]RNB94447.1 D-alanyl-D-alanine carboxypeptidase [Brevibacillus parabrevis]GEB35320.1 hypothetical protein BPA01_49000 [Brevibacillus parabrevis]
MIELQSPKSVQEAQDERQAIQREKDSLGALGQELAQEKIKGMQKDMMIDSLGQKVAQLTLEVIQLKGGGN